MTFNIEGKIAVVTGANRGIGKAIVETFLDSGVKKIYLAVRDTDSVAALVAGYGDKVEAIQADLTKAESIVALAAQATDADIVVNNAGLLVPSNPLDVHAEEALRQEFEVNTFGLMRVAQAFSATLETNQGALVQINSVASIKNFVDLTTYSASKAASYSITQGLKDVLTPKGISVLSVHPGPIATDMAKQAGMEEMGEPPAVVAKGIVSALQAGDFHLFPDTMARDFGGAYQSYAQSIVEPLPEQS